MIRNLVKEESRQYSPRSNRQYPNQEKMSNSQMECWIVTGPSERFGASPQSLHGQLDGRNLLTLHWDPQNDGSGWVDESDLQYGSV